jgi:hypothetical protein
MARGLPHRSYHGFEPGHRRNKAKIEPAKFGWAAGRIREALAMNAFCNDKEVRN